MLKTDVVEVSSVLSDRRRGRPRSPIPTLYRHKQTDAAYVVLNGRTTSFGPWGHPTTVAKYNDFVQRLLSGEPITTAPDVVIQKIETRTVNDLGEAWLRHIEVAYQKRGQATSYVSLARKAFELLKRSGLGSTSIQAFGPKALKEFQAKLASAVQKKRRRTTQGELVFDPNGKPVHDVVKDAKGRAVPAYSRKTINEYVKYVPRCYKWAVSEELVDETLYRRLLTVPGLSRGRSPIEGVPLRENQAIQPVSMADLKATLPHLSSVLQSMVQVQLLGSMRPAEVCYMRPCDIEPITQDKKVVALVYHVPEHVAKLDHLGLCRDVYFGPRGVQVLAELIKHTPPGEYVFSPKAARREHDAKRREQRKTPRWPSHSSEVRKARRQSGDDGAGDHYRTDTYGRAIRRACERAGVAPWSPNQLRHTAATQLAEQTGGLDASRLMLGHSSIATTKIYAKSATRLRALEVAMKHG